MQQSLLCPSTGNIGKKLRGSRVIFPRMMGGPLIRGKEQSMKLSKLEESKSMHVRFLGMVPSRHRLRSPASALGQWYSLEDVNLRPWHAKE